MKPLVFPVVTGPGQEATFAQTWGAPRAGERAHEGADVMAPLGSELVAIADGRIKHAIEPRGGKAVYLVEPDGTQYYYAHLDTFAAPLLEPGKTREVRAGETIGYLGQSGNAATPHLHFEVRPGGGPKVDPFPLLQSLAKRVESHAPRVVSPPGIPTWPGLSSAKAGLGAGAVVLFLFLLAKGRG